VSDGFFTFGVDVGGVAEVHGDDHAGVGFGEGHGLGFTEEGGGHGVTFVVEGGDLDEVEGEVALFPFGAPVLDEGGEEAAVLLGFFDVTLALIPDGAFDFEGDEGVDHAVVEEGGGLLVDAFWEVFAFGEGGGEFVLVGGVFAEGGFEFGEFFTEDIGVDPGFGGGSSPVGGDEADGDVEFLVEFFAEEVGSRGRRRS